MGFGFDPRLILAADKPTETLSDLLNSRSQRQVQGATLADLAQKQQRAATLADLYRQNANAPDALPAALMGAGFGQEAYGAQDQAAQLQGQAAQRAKIIADIRAAELKQMGDAFYGVKDQAGWEAALQQAPEHYRPIIPQQFDPAIAQRFANMAIPAEKRAGLEATATEAEKRRAFETEQKELDRKNRTTNAGILAGQKAAEQDSKAATASRKNYLEGYELGPDSEPEEKEMTAIRKAQANARTITQTVAEMQGLYKKYGNATLPGPVRAKMEALSTDLMMAAKGPEMYALGVIAGPDEKLLNRVVANPTTAESTILDFVGDDQSMARLGAFRGQVLRRFDNSARSLGFHPKATATTPAKAGTKTATAKLTPEQRQARIAEIEAELAEDGE